ncbi:MAG: hypothetical protein NZ929_03760 [Aigarchaeota archaeon]|nr:hypothetical protein [Aigarchaeota archaeon]MCX8192802.1 hypothetical protein [Nitrososphaeria archaeon]MDW7986046.1 hypothetical protein [Nitrososphaerota archaeon]
MVPVIDLETAFWITFDTALASIAIYLLIKYTKLKKNTGTTKSDAQANPLYKSLDIRSYFSTYDKKRAVATLFNDIISEITRVNGLTIPKSSTMKEVLIRLDNTIPRYTYVLLQDMYELYERIRFGNHDPTDEEINEFVNKIELFTESFRRPVGVEN